MGCVYIAIAEALLSALKFYAFFFQKESPHQLIPNSRGLIGPAAVRCVRLDQSAVVERGAGSGVEPGVGLTWWAGDSRLMGPGRCTAHLWNLLEEHERPFHYRERGAFVSREMNSDFWLDREPLHEL